ncbi:MAG: MFS transporter [Pseudomonadales bacterium]
MKAEQASEPRSQLELLKSRRFLPLFVTQFLGAFNDNVYKNSLILLIAFYLVDELTLSTDVLINLAAMLFILPYFLFSATAGQIADKIDKAILVRYTKNAEILIMCVGAVAFWFESLTGLFLLLFLMGTQSAFFSPAKYSLLPQHLEPEELVGGNAHVEMGTFVAIVLGLLAANFLTALPDREIYIGVAVITLAIIGRMASQYIPSAPPPDPGLKLNPNIWQQTLRIMSYARVDHAVFHSIFGVSWFWFFGSVWLTQIPNFSRYHLHGSADVTTLVLCVFSIGIGLGTMLCERLSGKKVELGLVPFGAAGLSLASFDLFFALPLESSKQLLSIGEFLALDGSYRVLIDLALIGTFGGFFIVPLMALIQQRTPAEKRAQVIAASNIINSLFMVSAAIIGVISLEYAGLDIPQLFLMIALMNIAVAVWVFGRVPEFGMRFLIWMLSHTMYRVEHENLDAVPDEGAGVLVCNHVSYVDALLLAGACRRPIRFIMFKPIYELPVLNFVFRTGRAIPIISKHVDEQGYEQAFNEISAALDEGDLLCIFPEGKLTQDGEMNEFKQGIERIIERNPVPVLPMALQGLWGSYFSHRDGHALTTLPRRFWSRVKIVAGTLVPPEQVSAERLYNEVLQLRGGKA